MRIKVEWGRWHRVRNTQGADMQLMNMVSKSQKELCGKVMKIWIVYIAHEANTRNNLKGFEMISNNAERSEDSILKKRNRRWEKIPLFGCPYCRLIWRRSKFVLRKEEEWGGIWHWYWTWVQAFIQTSQYLQITNGEVEVCEERMWKWEKIIKMFGGRRELRKEIMPLTQGAEHEV